MEKQTKERVPFPAEDGHIESMLVGVQEVKVSFQDYMGRKFVILFHDVEEFHSADTNEQCMFNQDIGEFTVCKLTDVLNEYCFVGAWDENTFLKIKAKTMEIHEVGAGANDCAALFRLNLDYIGDQLWEDE